MQPKVLDETVARIQQMEACFDHLYALLHGQPPTVDEALLSCLLRYYEGGQWRKDYELDEQGLLPRDLKRGVLSEDAVYNLLLEIQNRKEN